MSCLPSVGHLFGALALWRRFRSCWANESWRIPTASQSWAFRAAHRPTLRLQRRPQSNGSFSSGSMKGSTKQRSFGSGSKMTEMPPSDQKGGRQCWGLFPLLFADLVELKFRIGRWPAGHAVGVESLWRKRRWKDWTTIRTWCLQWDRCDRVPRRNPWPSTTWFADDLKRTKPSWLPPEDPAA